MSFIRYHRQPAPAVLVFSAIVALAIGCGKKNNERQTGEQTGERADDPHSGPGADGTHTPGAAVDKPSVAGQPGDQGAQTPGGDDRNSLTPEEYETLLLDMANCKIKGEHVDPRCPAKLKFKEARSRRDALKDLAGLTAELGKKHIKHTSPAVRVQAAGFLSSIFGTNEESQTIILEAARTEKEPAVLVAMIQSMGSKGGRNPKVGQLLLELADHENTAVRKKAMVWLGSVWNRELEGSMEKLIEKVESDSDSTVRQFACRYSGSRGDDRMVPIYAKYTKDPEADPKLYAACMEGLMNSWMHYPLFGTSSEKAYQLTLKRLAHKPRSQVVPPWGLLDNFAELAKDQNPKVADWKKRATWYKPAVILKLLEPIVADRQAYRLARSGALKSMLALGASKAQLKRIRKRYEGVDNQDDKSLINELDKAIAGQ